MVMQEREHYLGENMPIFVSVCLFFGMLFSTAIVANPWCKNHNKHGDRFPPIVSEKIYFDSQDMPMDQDGFHIRVGSNEWIKSNTVHSDESGFYTHDSDIERTGDSLAYEKHWQCPYCHLFFKWGSPCTNANCPSKFKGQYELD